MTQNQKSEILLNLANLTEKIEEANKIIQYIGEQVQNEEVTAVHSQPPETMDQ